MTHTSAPLTQTTVLTPSLYDTDLFLWAQTNVQLLRERRFDDLDVAHIIEEIEDMGKSEKRGVKSHLSVLLSHLLKWEFQPSHRCGSWLGSISNARQSIADLIEESPSLVDLPKEVLLKAYASSRKIASAETGLKLVSFPETCTYTMEQILDEEWLPE
jgi:Domain of unknown function DUF29